MASSTTRSFNRTMLNQFKKDLDSDGVEYFIGIAKNTPFSLTAPLDIKSIHYQSEMRHTLQSVKTLASNSFVVPLINWTPNIIWQEYDDGLTLGATDQVTQFYVLNSLNEVFVCIQQRKLAGGQSVISTVEPTSILATGPTRPNSPGRTFQTSDEYLWRQVGVLSNLAIANFKTANWMPIKQITDRSDFLPILEESTQRNLQDSAIAGEIINIAIDSGGYGYTEAPSIIIGGDGEFAAFSCEISDGKIVKINIDSAIPLDDIADPTGFTRQVDVYSGHGRGYTHASAQTATGGAVLRPILGPKEGLNANPVVTLKAESLMVQADFAGNEFNEILANNDFAQVALLRDIKQNNGDPFVANTGNAMKHIEITVNGGGGSVFIEDELISNAGESVFGRVFYHDILSTPNKLYYYQDDETGHVPFTSADTSIKNFNQNQTTATVVSLQPSDFDIYSGDVLYINNLDTAIDRADNQTEDIRIVIQLGQN